jgi:hypothetical protein
VRKHKNGKSLFFTIPCTKKCSKQSELITLKTEAMVGDILRQWRIDLIKDEEWVLLMSQFIDDLN